MDALALAQRRTALRRREEGAVMFIVAMTLAVLASVGVYALAAAATEVKMSGNERQNTQTHYLVEFGVLGAAREIAGGRAEPSVRAMVSPPITPPPPGYVSRDTECVSLPNVPNTAPNQALACLRMGSQELSGANRPGVLPWTQPVVPLYGNNPAYTPGIPPGSFGSMPMNADFFIELTNPRQAPAAGFSFGGSGSKTCFAQLTVTSVGYTRPSYPGGSNPTAEFGGEGVETQRARIIAGPLTPCPLPQ